MNLLPRALPKVASLGFGVCPQIFCAGGCQDGLFTSHGYPELWLDGRKLQLEAPEGESPEGIAAQVVANPTTNCPVTVAKIRQQLARSRPRF